MNSSRTYFTLFPEAGASLDNYVENAYLNAGLSYDNGATQGLTTSALILSATKDQVCMLYDKTNDHWILPGVALDTPGVEPQVAAHEIASTLAGTMLVKALHVVAQDPQVPLDYSMAAVRPPDYSGAKPVMSLDLCYPFVASATRNDLYNTQTPVLDPNGPVHAEWIFFDDERAQAIAPKIGKMCRLRMVAVNEWNRTAAV
ncbi:MAG TPA: hypothetical protein VF575_02170 [Candidatus Saccharimonadales bacterium]